jgi:hypothetical protein
LRDEVFQVISVFTPVDNWVYSFGWQQRVDVRWVTLVLVEVIQYLINRLLVIMLNVFKFLSRISYTMLEAFYRLSMGIFSKKYYFFYDKSCYIYSD